MAKMIACVCSRYCFLLYAPASDPE